MTVWGGGGRAADSGGTAHGPAARPLHTDPRRLGAHPPSLHAPPPVQGPPACHSCWGALPLAPLHPTDPPRVPSPCPPHPMSHSYTPPARPTPAPEEKGWSWAVSLGVCPQVRSSPLRALQFPLPWSLWAGLLSPRRRVVSFGWAGAVSPRLALASSHLQGFHSDSLCVTAQVICKDWSNLAGKSYVVLNMTENLDCVSASGRAAGPCGGCRGRAAPSSAREEGSLVLSPRGPLHMPPPFVVLWTVSCLCRLLFPCRFGQFSTRVLSWVSAGVSLELFSGGPVQPAGGLH